MVVSICFINILGYLELNDPAPIDEAYANISDFLRMMLYQRCNSNAAVNNICKSLNLVSLKMKQMTQMFKNGKSNIQFF